MVWFHEATVTDATAQTLLGEYFAERAAGFPSAQGCYRTTQPVPEQFTRPAGAFLLVTDDTGEAIGCGGVRRIQRSPSDVIRLEVKHLYLRPTARGSGSGRLMLAELERVAAELGAGELVLDTNESLEAAGSLYRSSGYREIEPYNANPNATHWFGKPVTS
ncbi:GNAT family N-acetyltransferase [Luethyella okanaganae]|uniref:GNAT family N-acetyltransferase n=1 Tax=Luethyella okanaganae TaxID=69372 RepID=A0ABW1VKZ1_9MICO